MLENRIPALQQKRRLVVWFAATLVLGTAGWLGSKRARVSSFSVQRDSRTRDFGLNLKVQQQGDYWRISWTRNPASLPKQTPASLLIKDGATEKRVLLDWREFASTTILYGPAGNGPIFQLAVGNERGEYRSETVRTMFVTSSATMQPARNVGRPPEPGRAVARGNISLDVKDKAESSVSRKILPSVPMSARVTIRGNILVDVKANLSPSGEVTDVELKTPARSAYFARLALAAAKQWHFPPGNTGFRVLRFEFSKDGDHASLLENGLP